MNDSTVIYTVGGAEYETGRMTAGDAYSTCDRLRAGGHPDAVVLTYH